jgi:dGTPase
MDEATPRERYEAFQRRRLAPWAVHEAAAGPREAPEDEHPYRTCFQRDRDRVIHCSAFRRLDYKTQVFVPHEQDHFRTRLTHTMEVAQIGRDLGRALGLNEDLIEAAALAHDLGHPPFGHAGEEALAELMADHGGFEHNRQSLRVVDVLEHPYPQFRGLNLTGAVRECIAKHRTPYDRPAAGDFPPGLAPLEGQIVDLADQIAYTSADLEDALAAGWIAVEQLGGLRLWRQAWEEAAAAAPNAGPVHKRIRAGKNVLAAMADDVVAATPSRAAALGVGSPEAARAAGDRCVAFSPAVAEAVAQMQEFLLREVYQHPRAAEEDREARQMIGELFAAYVAEAAELPGRYRRRVEAQGLHRVACDYIAGMTDRFAREAHGRLGGR